MAACAGFRAYALWIDCVSAAAKSDAPAVSTASGDYIDWFTVGVAPYLLLPTIVMATGRDRHSRMWLRMEEKLGQYGEYSVYALRSSSGDIVRLEPGAAEIRAPYERIWCLCQSVVRGEYNNLETTFREDYLNLLEWAAEFDRGQVNFRGLQRVFDEGSGKPFRGRLPIETGCYVVLPVIPRTPWLHGAEMLAGRVEHLVASNDLGALKSLRDDARRLNAGAKLFWLTMRNGRQLVLHDVGLRDAARHILDRRWRSYATSMLLVVELRGGGWWNRVLTVRRTVLVGVQIDGWNAEQWNFEDKYSLEVIPEPVRRLVGVANTTVGSVTRITMEDFTHRLSE